jgi:hypothetical protein
MALRSERSAITMALSLALAAQEPEAGRGGSPRNNGKSRHGRSARAELVRAAAAALSAPAASASRTLVLTFGDIKTGSGFALGPAYGKLLDTGALIYAKSAYSIRNFKMAQVSFHAPPAAGGRLAIDGRLRWQDAPTLPFYPIGPNSEKSRSTFSRRRPRSAGGRGHCPCGLSGLAGCLRGLIPRTWS